MDGGTLVLALFLGTIALPAVVWATSGGNIGTASSSCLRTLILVGVVVDLGAWVTGD